MRIIPTAIGIGVADQLTPKILAAAGIVPADGFGLDDVAYILLLTIGAWAGNRYLPSFGA